MDEHSISIRRATVNDAELLAQLGTETWINAYITNKSTPTLQSSTALTFSVEQLEQQLADFKTIFLIAEVEHTAAGFAQMRDGEILKSITGPKPLEIERFYIRKTWTDKGVDLQLMHSCISYARQYGFRTIWLSAWKYNEGAKTFYKQWNFCEVGVYYVDITTNGSQEKIELSHAMV